MLRRLFKVSICVIILSFYSYSICPSSYSIDQNNDNPGDSSFDYESEYSPSYIKQSVLQTNLLEINSSEIELRNMIENTQDESKDDGVEMDVKGPRAGLEPTSYKQETTIVPIPINNDTYENPNGEEEISIELVELIPRQIFEFIDNRGASLRQYRVIQNGEYFNLVWSENNDQQEIELFTQTFDKNGSSVNDCIVSLGTSYFDTIQSNWQVNRWQARSGVWKLSNGNIVVFTLPQFDVNDNYRYLTCFSMLNPKGEKLSSISFWNSGLAAQELDGGGYALFWASKEQDTYHLNVRTIEPDGVTLSDTVVLNEGRSLERHTNFTNVHRLSNGNMAVIWREDHPDSGDELRMKIMDRNGIFLEQETILMKNNLPNTNNLRGLVQVREFSEEKYLVTWHDFQMDQDGTPQPSLRLGIFSHQGEPVGDFTTLMVYGGWHFYYDVVKRVLFPDSERVVFIIKRENRTSVVLYNHELAELEASHELYVRNEQLSEFMDLVKSSRRYIQDAFFAQNGDLITIWREHTYVEELDRYVQVLMMRRYDNDFNIKGEVYTFLGDISLFPIGPHYKYIYSEYFKTLELPNGRLVVLWETKYESYATWFDPDGNLINGDVKVTSRTPETEYHYPFLSKTSIFTFKNGNIAFFTYEPLEGSRISREEMLIYDQNGNFINGLEFIYTGYTDYDPVVSQIDAYNFIETGYEPKSLLFVQYLKDDTLLVVWSCPDEERPGYDILKMKIINSLGHMLVAYSTDHDDNDSVCIAIDKVLVDENDINIQWREETPSIDIAFKRATIKNHTEESNVITDPSPALKDDIFAEHKKGYIPSLFLNILPSLDLLYKVRTNNNDYTDYGKRQEDLGIDIGSNITGIKGSNSLKRKITADMNIYHNLSYSGDLAESIRTSLSQAVGPERSIEKVSEPGSLDQLIEAIAENRKVRPDLKDTMIEASRVLFEESAYMDAKTLEGFKDIINLVMLNNDAETLTDNKYINAVCLTLTELVEEHKKLYMDYLKETDVVYAHLANILLIDIDNSALPEAYIYMSDIGFRSKRKILIDLAIEKLKRMDAKDLSETEIKALKMDREALSLVRSDYIAKLSEAIRSASKRIKVTLEQAGNVSIAQAGEGFKALIRLDKETVPKN